MLSNQKEIDNTGHARRDSTDLDVRKTFEVKKSKRLSIQHPVPMSAVSSKPGSVTHKAPTLTMSRLLHQKILHEVKQPTSRGGAQADTAQTGSNTYASVLKPAKLPSASIPESSSFVYKTQTSRTQRTYS